MALSNVIKNMRDGSLTITDGTGGTPLSKTVQFDQGDFSLNNLKTQLSNTVSYETRGFLRSVRHTEREYPEGNFSVMVSQFSEATVGTAIDAALKNGYFAAAVSTRGSSAEVMTYDIQFTMAGSVHGDAANHTFTMKDVELKLSSFTEGDPNTASFDFTVWGEITGDLACSE